VQERIPPTLWDQAVVLTTRLPGSQVAKRLRLSPTDLKSSGQYWTTVLTWTLAISSGGSQLIQQNF
jgi:hypothetical protein